MRPAEDGALQIGFIGLGDQGGPMVLALLAAGNTVTVWARRAEAARPLREAGAQWADTPAALAAATGMLAMCVTDEAAIHDILLDRGALENIRPGGILAIHSTIAPAAIAALAERASARGIRLLDAPVSGSGAAVARRKLMLMVSGDADAAETLSTCYAAFCDPIIHAGSIGAATRLKLINNLKCAVDYALAGQAIGLAASQGLNVRMARLALASGTGRSFALEAIERIADEGRADHVAAVLAKDVALALAAFGNEVPAVWAALAVEGIAALRRRA